MMTIDGEVVLPENDNAPTDGPQNADLLAECVNCEILLVEAALLLDKYKHLIAAPNTKDVINACLTHAAILRGLVAPVEGPTP